MKQHLSRCMEQVPCHVGGGGFGRGSTGFRAASARQWIAGFMAIVRLVCGRLLGCTRWQINPVGPGLTRAHCAFGLHPAIAHAVERPLIVQRLGVAVMAAALLPVCLAETPGERQAREARDWLTLERDQLGERDRNPPTTTLEGVRLDKTEAQQVQRLNDAHLRQRNAEQARNILEPSRGTDSRSPPGIRDSRPSIRRQLDTRLRQTNRR